MTVEMTEDPLVMIEVHLETTEDLLDTMSDPVTSVVNRSKLFRKKWSAFSIAIMQ